MYQYSCPDTKSEKILCPKMFGGKILTTKIDTHGMACHRGMQQGCLPPERIDKVGYRGLVPGAEEKGRAVIFPLRLTSLPRGGQAHTLAL